MPRRGELMDCFMQPRRAQPPRYFLACEPTSRSQRSIAKLSSFTERLGAVFHLVPISSYSGRQNSLTVSWMSFAPLSSFLALIPGPMNPALLRVHRRRIAEYIGHAQQDRAAGAAIRRPRIHEAAGIRLRPGEQRLRRLRRVRHLARVVDEDRPARADDRGHEEAVAFVLQH